MYRIKYYLNNFLCYSQNIDSFEEAKKTLEYILRQNKNCKPSIETI